MGKKSNKEKAIGQTILANPEKPLSPKEEFKKYKRYNFNISIEDKILDGKKIEVYCVGGGYGETPRKEFTDMESFKKELTKQIDEVLG
jgi:hypothetical protein